MSKGNAACISFLKWALPVLNMRWEGYKKVRGQVCAKINKRLKELHMKDYEEYKSYLNKHQEEWTKLDGMMHITISRFFRDKKQWDVLQHNLLPELVKAAKEENRSFLVWSPGCASGEEPYSMAVLWKQAIEPMHPHVEPVIIATDADGHMLKRAEDAKYSKGSLKEMPVEWREKVFKKENGHYHLQHEYQEMVHFEQQDIRKEMPDGPFDIIFCKNLVAMYFNQKVSIKVFQKISDRLRKGGYLFLGNHEEFPLEGVEEIMKYDKGINLYRKE